MQKQMLAWVIVALVALAVGCDDTDDAGQGTLAVSIYGEAFIEEGIPGGAPGCDGCVEDGWAVTFDRFLVVVTSVEVRGPETVRDDTARVFDLAEASPGAGAEAGQRVVEFAVAAGTYDRLDYTVGPAGAGLVGAAEDVAAVGQNAVYVEGQATREGVTVRVAWGFAGVTRYVDCETAARVEAGGVGASQLTIHADHLLYDDLVSAEPRVVFDLIAASDGDGDGVVTAAEMGARDISGEARYQVGNAAIDDLWGFVAAQVGTLGHIDGEGHCEVE